MTRKVVNMGINYNPNLSGYSGVTAFRFWCQTVLPLVYDDSLSYYELLCKVVDYLNKTIADVATCENNISELATAFSNLQNYVNNYFEEADFSKIVSDELNKMGESGELERLLGLSNYVLKTDIATNVQSGNSNPVSSDAVYSVVGDVESALEIINTNFANL